MSHRTLAIACVCLLALAWGSVCLGEDYRQSAWKNAAVANPSPPAAAVPTTPVRLGWVGDVSPLVDPNQTAPTERRLGLNELLAQSLKHSDVVRVLQGGGVTIDSTTRYEPGIQAARLEGAESIFDPRVSAGFIGSRINEAPSTFFGPGLPQQVRRDEGDFTASLSKLWATGGTTTLSYAPPLGYLFIPDGSSTGAFNPTYSAQSVLDVRQPLLRGAGRAVNLAPVRIAQLRLDQSAWDVKQALMGQVRSVEETYWDLQAANVMVQAIDAILPLAEEICRVQQARLEAELVIRADVARAQVQLSQYRQTRVRYDADVREQEYRLRNLTGMSVVDGSRLFPSDVPLQAPPALDAEGALAVAVEQRPDLVRQRMNLKIREWELLVAQNGMNPQVDLRGLYRTNGVGQGLDDALSQMSQYRYTDWTLGVTFSMPLGNRPARANLRAVEQQLMRERALMHESVRNVSFRIADLIRELQATWSQFEEARQRAVAASEWLNTARLRFTNPPPASQSPDGMLVGLYDYQTALNAHIEAIVEGCQLLARYNGLLARYEEAQGTLLASRGVEFADDPCHAVNQHEIPLYWSKRSEHTVMMPAPVSSPAPTVVDGTGFSGPTGDPNLSRADWTANYRVSPTWSQPAVMRTGP
ncbi:MAG TPA: TolC family protein [Planctomycetaceae bacterium]|jgi:outer membrane protein TolC|nr:TolC family protein [Planctomycetaceae bacterium]